MLNRAHHSGSDLLDSNGRGRYFSEAARSALSRYGPLWFCYLETLAPHLGTYGDKIRKVQTHAQVDEHLAETSE